MNDETLNRFIEDIEGQYDFFEKASNRTDKEYSKGSRDAYGYVLATLRDLIEDE
jgi:hypothetical protein